MHSPAAHVISENTRIYGGKWDSTRFLLLATVYSFQQSRKTTRNKNKHRIEEERELYNSGNAHGEEQIHNRRSDSETHFIVNLDIWNRGRRHRWHTILLRADLESSTNQLCLWQSTMAGYVRLLCVLWTLMQSQFKIYVHSFVNVWTCF